MKLKIFLSLSIVFQSTILFAAFPTSFNTGAAEMKNASFQQDTIVGITSGKSEGGSFSNSGGFLISSENSFTEFLQSGAPLLVSPAPGTFSATKFVESLDRSMILQWTEGSNQLPVQYKVFFGTNPTSIPLTITTRSKNHTVDQLEYLRPYFWRVEPFDQFSRSTLSPLFSFSIAPPIGNFYAAPNPFQAGREKTTFIFKMPGAGQAEFEIKTLPHLVKVFETTLVGLQDGNNTFIYDGKDNEGNTLYNGVYIALITMRGEKGEFRQRFKFMVIR